MADNVIIDVMTGGDSVAADDIGGIKFQRMKLIHGADGVNDGDVSTANPLPIRLYYGTVAASVGAGAVGTGVPRTTLASDDPAVVSLQIIDDWDESDRAKVNPIVGQAGVAGGAGAVGATTQRTTLASDDPAVTALQIMDDWDNAASDGASISGDVAHDGADAGEPVKIGYKAIAHGTNPTAVAANDRTNAYANRHGIPFVIGGHPNIITLEAAYTAAQTDTAIVSVSAGAKIVVTQIMVVCDNANTVDVGVRVGFGTANTPTTTGVVATHPGIAPGSGFSRGDGSGILGVGADGEDLRITCEVPTTGSVRVLVSYYTIES